MRKTGLLLTLTLIVSCNSSIPKSYNKIKSTPAEYLQNQYEAGAVWLKESIENEFNNHSGDMDRICTLRYQEFKTDAISIEYDGMTLKQFRQKWGRIYNTKKVNQYSFLISQQDYGKIEVISVIYKKTSSYGNWYSVTIKDIDFGVVVNRDIRIIINNKEAYLQTYLIDEVLENE